MLYCEKCQHKRETKCSVESGWGRATNYQALTEHWGKLSNAAMLYFIIIEQNIVKELKKGQEKCLYTHDRADLENNYYIII